MYGQNEIVRLFGGSRHWSKDQTPDGTYPEWLVYVKPGEFTPVFLHMPDQIYEPSYDREVYTRQCAQAFSQTKCHNLVYKLIVFYVCKGYKLSRRDLAVIQTDLNHDVRYVLEKAEGRSWWNLSPAEQRLAAYERSCIEGKIPVNHAFPKVGELAGDSHGPGFSEEFEKSFDNL